MAAIHVESRGSFREPFRTWARVGLFSFCGPAGQIAVMHRILVEEKRWITENRFLHALNYCMLLPGPEAQQLATYVGRLLHGWREGVVAGTLFVLPGFLSILVLSILYTVYQQADLVVVLFFGLKAATLAVVVEAMFRIGKRTLKNRAMVLVAAFAFVGDAASANLPSIAIALGAFMAMFKLKWNIILTLGVAAAVGSLYTLVLRPWLFGA